MNKLAPLSNTSDVDAPSAQFEGMDIHSNVVTPGELDLSDMTQGE